jgi:hypothetical protein
MSHLLALCLFHESAESEDESHGVDGACARFEQGWAADQVGGASGAADRDVKG